MNQLLSFLSGDAQPVHFEVSPLIIQACVLASLVSFVVAGLSFLAWLKRKNSAQLWLGSTALLHGFWNIFFVITYSSRGDSYHTLSQSSEVSHRLYLILGLALTSITHSTLKRVLPARYILSNRIHFVAFVLGLVAIWLEAKQLFRIQLVIGAFVFGAFAFMTNKIWRRYHRTQDLPLKTRSLFIAVGMTVCIGLSLIGQIRAEALLPIPLPYLGSLFTVVFLYFIYLMLENPRLRELRDLMLQGLRLIFLSIIFVSVYLIFIALAEVSDVEHLVFNSFLASLLLLLLFEPLRNALDKFLLQRLSVDRYEFQKIVRSTQRRSRKARSLKQLIHIVIEGLKESDRIYKTGFYLWDQTANQFRLFKKGNLSTKPLLENNHPLVSFLQSHRPLYLQEPGDSPERAKLLKDLKAHLIFPIFSGEQLRAIWIIRSSLSDNNPYTNFSKVEIQSILSLIHDMQSMFEQLEHFERQEQQHRLATLGEMSAALAHEIRNPLGAIQGATHLLKSSPSLTNSEDKECVQILSEELDRLEQTVSHYLEYARRPETKADINLLELIKKSIDDSKTKAEKTGTQIHFSASETDLLVQTDPIKLEQVLVNLITNSCEAFSKNIWIEAQPLGEKVEIRIRDDGPGIPAQILPSIFTPLFTTKRAGSGLGLPICKKIIESLHGSIRVESKPNHGTTFSIQLNLSQTSSSQTL